MIRPTVHAAPIKTPIIGPQSILISAVGSAFMLGRGCVRAIIDQSQPFSSLFAYELVEGHSGPVAD